MNKCGFHILEFWNAKNPEPNMPSDFAGDENVKSVLQNFRKKHSLVGFDVK